MASAPAFRLKAAPVYYRRRRADVLAKLPELIENEEWCQMGARETAVYEEAAFARKHALVRRVSWSVGDPMLSSKAQRLKEIVAEAAEDGRKVIVFSFFLDTLEMVRRTLGPACMETITGSVSPQRRQEIIDEFDEAQAGTALALQIQAGGTGLNIQSASVVVICEPQLKPSIENQAISRAYRMGQARNVLVHRLLCPDSIDERMMNLLEKKQREFDAFTDKSRFAYIWNQTKSVEQTLSGPSLTLAIQHVEPQTRSKYWADASTPPFWPSVGTVLILKTSHVCVLILTGQVEAISACHLPGVTCGPDSCLLSCCGLKRKHA